MGSTRDREAGYVVSVAMCVRIDAGDRQRRGVVTTHSAIRHLLHTGAWIDRGRNNGWMNKATAEGMGGTGRLSAETFSGRGIHARRRSFPQINRAAGRCWKALSPEGFGKGNKNPNGFQRGARIGVWRSGMGLVFRTNGPVSDTGFQRFQPVHGVSRERIRSLRAIQLLPRNQHGLESLEARVTDGATFHPPAATDYLPTIRLSTSTCAANFASISTVDFSRPCGMSAAGDQGM